MERQQAAVVLEQHLRLVAGLARQRQSRRRLGHGVVVVGVRPRPLRDAVASGLDPWLGGDVVELAELHARGEEALERRVDVALVEGVRLCLDRLPRGLGHGVEVVEAVAEAGVAVEVLACGHRERVALGVVQRPGPAGRLPVMAGDDLEDRVAVRREVAVEAERLARKRVDEVHARGCRGPVDAVVGGHDRAGVRLLDDPPELRGVVLAERPLVHVRRAGTPVDLAVVRGEVLDSRDRLEVAAALRQQVALLVLALHPVDELRRDRGGQERVLAEGLVVAAPARVAPEVDRRRVEVEVAHVVGHHFARLVGDRARLPVHQAGIPTRPERQVDRVRRRVREDRRVAARVRLQARDTVQRLVPPAVRRDPEPWIAGAWLNTVCDAFSASVMRDTRSAARSENE